MDFWLLLPVGWFSIEPVVESIFCIIEPLLQRFAGVRVEGDLGFQNCLLCICNVLPQLPKDLSIPCLEIILEILQFSSKNILRWTTAGDNPTVLDHHGERFMGKPHFFKLEGIFLGEKRFLWDSRIGLWSEDSLGRWDTNGSSKLSNQFAFARARSSLIATKARPCLLLAQL